MSVSNHTTIWHNPKCSKSRQTLALLEQQGISPSNTESKVLEIVEYLKAPPTAPQILAAIKMLGVEPRGLMRTKEEVYKTLDLGNSSKSNEDLVEAMVANPILIERPLVIHDGKAAIGRPPENVLEIL